MRTTPVRVVVILAGLLAFSSCAEQPVGSTLPAETTTPSHTQTPPTEPPPAPRSVSVNVSGDLLWHNTLWTSAELDAGRTGVGDMDFYPQLASLTDYVTSASVSVCHSEVPFAPPGGPYRNYPLFAAPPEIAPALAQVGWDLCTTASNHSLDEGWDGLVRTIEVHSAADIRTVGTYRSQEEAETPVVIETEDGVKVGFVSQTFSLNGLSLPADKPWAVDLLDAERAVAAAEATKRAGADIVGVHVHAGTEYSHEINSQQRRFAEVVTASDAVDFVFGQHAHVVQPIDRVNDKWVVYGSGNLLAASGPAQPYTYDGFMATVIFEERHDGSFHSSQLEWAPTMITQLRGQTPARVYLIPHELADDHELAEQLRASAQRTRAVVTAKHPEGLRELDG